MAADRVSAHARQLNGLRRALIMGAALALTISASTSGVAQAAAPAAGPEPMSPEDGTNLASIGPVRLTWRSPGSAAAFEVSVAPGAGDGPGMDLIISDAAQVAQQAFTIDAPLIGSGNYVLLPGMTYGWRVRVAVPDTTLSNAVQWGAWSPARTFRTPAPSSRSVMLTSPPDLSEVRMGASPTLRWSNADTAIFYYEVQLSSDQRFATGSDATSAVYWNLVHGGLHDPLNSWTPPFTLPSGGLYYWRVRPRVQGDGVPVDWSHTSSFRTATPIAPVLPVAQQVLRAINTARVQQGLAALQQMPTIDAAAQRHSDDMATADALSHTGSDGSNAGDRLHGVAYGWRAYGEIIAAGLSTADATVAAWLGSPPHRAILLSADYTEFGAGMAATRRGRTYWTADFGTR